MSELGAYLRKCREDRKFTLRDVELITGGKVSNGYLSQLETGKVCNPSAIILHRLSAAYGVAFEEVMSVLIRQEPEMQLQCPTCGKPL